MGKGRRMMKRIRRRREKDFEREVKSFREGWRRAGRKEGKF